MPVSDPASRTKRVSVPGRNISAMNEPTRTDRAAGRPRVEMYSSAWCPFCLMAKRLLGKKGITVEYHGVDGRPALRAEMEQRSGRHTVPQIFIGGVHVGGCDDLHALERAGGLDTLLAGSEA
jgi:glutaredoxin 3